jgi:hypothetical protein
VNRHVPGVWYIPHQGWHVTEPLPIRVTEGLLTIPAGFKSDLASIPKFLRIIPGFDCYECGIPGPVCHDAIYQGIVGRDLGIDRRRADRILHTLMRCDGVGRVRSWIVWAAVRLFGWWAWRQMPQRNRLLWSTR